MSVWFILLLSCVLCAAGLRSSENIPEEDMPIADISATRVPKSYDYVAVDKGIVKSHSISDLFSQQKNSINFLLDFINDRSSNEEKIVLEITNEAKPSSDEEIGSLEESCSCSIEENKEPTEEKELWTEEEIESSKKKIYHKGENELEYKKLRFRRGVDNKYNINDVDYIESGSCVPPKLKTAEILCKKWATRIACNVHCVYGHTHSEGITRQTICLFAHDKWSKRIEECKPFVDCSLKARAPGNAKCSTHKVEQPDVCAVSCDPFDLWQGVSKTMITCDINGWRPALPFCVEPSGMKLVAAPVKRVHDIPLAYP